MSLKQEVLSALEANRDKDLSGQELAERFGVSRSAVWKVVNGLKKDGYEILSGTNKGYRLAQSSDMLSAEGIRQHLNKNLQSSSVFVFKELDSTSNEGKRMLANGFTGEAMIASEGQSDGRGRYGRFFYSPGRTGLYLTFLLQINASLSDATSLTAGAAVAAVRAIRALTGKEAWIKWVNDIFLNGRKIGGILTEAVSDFETGMVQSVLVGIGLNVTTVDFPEELQEIAGSLGPSCITRSRLAAEIANQLLPFAKDLSSKGYLSDYRRYSMVLGEPIEYTRDGKTFSGTAVSIGDDFGLTVVRDDGQREILRSGEVHITRMLS